MKKVTVEDEVQYVGGSLDGQLVRPSLANAALALNEGAGEETGICHCYRIPDADYPMAMHEDYHPKVINGKLTFKLAKTYKTEMTI
tara:strand:+ start:4011 stop:4268 length:258 start_codon:yes stop_codon:yes gene_type:complete